jgi:hypothetical protein
VPASAAATPAMSTMIDAVTVIFPSISYFPHMSI